jgi:hypothetical protein
MGVTNHNTTSTSEETVGDQAVAGKASEDGDQLEDEAGMRPTRNKKPSRRVHGPEWVK